MRHRIVALFACLQMVACAPAVWEKPGGTQAEFNQDSARCRLLARGMNSGDFYAEGSPKFVAAAALGNAIGTAINQQGNYRDCMMAVGYTPHAAAPESASPAAYGAFAFDHATGKFGFSVNKETQGRADDSALQGCANKTCRVVFRVGPQMCGAIAISDNGEVWGGATRPQSDSAEVAALQNCQRRTGRQCNVRGAECKR